jgi:hypothetical protein
VNAADQPSHRHDPGKQRFLSLSDAEVSALVAPHRLSISLLLNGTRRLFLATKLGAPPTDLSFLPACLDFIHCGMADLIRMLMHHGIHRIFLPAYSEDQHARDARAHHYLLEGIRRLTTHPALVQAYEDGRYAVRFYGDTTTLPESVQPYVAPVEFAGGSPPERFVHYGIDGGDPYRYIFQIVHDFGQRHGRPPTRNEVTEIYYGEREVRPLDIMIGFNRVYARLGIPPCLDGRDHIYTTAVSPLALTATMLRRVLYDYLYCNHDRGRNYLDVGDRQLGRLQSFYSENREAIIGLSAEIDGLCYPCPSIRWPSELADDVSTRE